MGLATWCTTRRRRFNLSTALRQPWTGFTSWLFYLPMAAVGVHPAVIAFCGGINLCTSSGSTPSASTRCGGWYEFLFNTPSHHRVHHGAQGGYLDQNFGGILIIWDRLFGTFAPETERVVYGLTKNIETYNPLRVAYHEYAAIARDLKAATHLARPLSPTWSKGPGWSSGQRPRLHKACETFERRGQGPTLEPGHSSGHATRPATPPGRWNHSCQTTWVRPGPIGVHRMTPGPRSTLSEVDDPHLVGRVDFHHPHLVAQHGRPRTDGDRLDHGALAAVARRPPAPW